MPNRSELRKRYRGLRNSLSSEQCHFNSEAIIINLLASKKVMGSSRIGLYLSNDGEVDLYPLVEHLQDTQVELALPIIGSNRSMVFVRYSLGDKLTQNQFGIPEPSIEAPSVKFSCTDTLLIPVVAFDGNGGRLGMGGGYYDRYIAALDAANCPFLVGVAHQNQRSSKDLPSGTWDKKMEEILTETGWQLELQNENLNI